MDLDSVTDASDHKAKLDLYRNALSKLLAQPSPDAWQEFVDHGVFSSCRHECPNLIKQGCIAVEPHPTASNILTCVGTSQIFLSESALCSLQLASLSKRAQTSANFV